MQRLAALFLVSAAALPLAAQHSVPAIAPDPRQGQVDGKLALSAWVIGDDPSEILDPTGYEVRLAPAGDLDQEIVYPAGHWFVPSPGRYRMWMQGNGRISSATSTLLWRGGPFKERGMVTVERLVPAGRVRLDSDRAVTAKQILRLLHLDSHLMGPHPQLEMSRRLIGEAAHRGDLMPEGRVLSALFDRESGDYLGVSRPVTVRHGETTVVDPQPPKAGTSHLVVLLERPKVIPRLDQYTLEARLRIGEEQRRPDLTIPTPSRLYAVWYDLPSGPARLSVESNGTFADPVDVRLRSGRAERLEVDLRPLPALDVSWQLPESLEAETVALQVRAISETELAAETEQPRERGEHRFTRLPVADVEVGLRVGEWLFLERSDLREGDGRVSFAPVPIAVHGTVFLGDEPSPASIGFEIGNDEQLSIETNEDGEYEVVVFRPIRAAVVNLATRDGSPFIADLFDDPIVASRRQDFEIPTNQVSVRVVDALTGAGLAGARVSVSSASEGGRRVAQHAMADDEGVAHLPPLREGELEVRASAEGYLPSGEPVVAVIAVDRPPAELTVRLRPEGERHPLRVVLPDGRPAAGAELMAQHSLGGSGPSWSRRTDSAGVVEVPTSLDGHVLLVRHSAAGFAARRWQAPEPEAPVTWPLPPASGLLRLRTTDVWGEGIGHVGLTLWVEGQRLEGAQLGWLTRTAAGSNGDGYWQATSVPLLPIRLLASKHRNTPLPQNLAQEVNPPWPPLVELVVVD